MSMYGNVFKWFFGIIIETGTDPSGLDRVKVRADGVHGSEIANNDLPFAQCILPNTGGGTSGIGENPRLEPGARVVGFFADGNLCQLPIIIGPIPHISEPNATQRSNRDGSAAALLTSIRPQARSFITDFFPTQTLTGDNADNRAKAWEFFSTSPGLNFKYRPHHIAGMIGNFIIEARDDGIEMNPDAKGTENAGTDIEYTAYGIAQWGIDRQKELQLFASTQNRAIDDLITQLKFVDWELKQYAFLRGQFFETENTEEATMMFMRQYERPQIKSDISKFVNSGKFGKPTNYWNARAAEELRLKEALKVYNEFTQYYPES